MISKPVLIDTSVWINALRKNPINSVKERVDALLEQNAVVITPIIKLELLGGTRTEVEFKRLKTRLDSLPNLKISESIWSSATKLAFELRRAGVSAPYTDILISQIAISYDAMLVHCDNHFNLISKKTPLAAENLTIN